MTDMYAIYGETIILLVYLPGGFDFSNGNVELFLIKKHANKKKTQKKREMKLILYGSIVIGGRARARLKPNRTSIY